MDSNYWYYTLSAIPQTLATALTLAATFLIFKMSFLNDKIESRAAEVAKLLAIAKSGNADEGDFNEMSGHQEMLRAFDGLLPVLKAGPDLLAKFAYHYNGAGGRPDLFDSSDLRHRKVAGHVQRLRDSFATLLEHKRLSFVYLKRNLILTLVPVSISLVLLPLHDHIERMPFHGYVVDDLFVAGLALCSIVSLSYTAYSVWKIANY